MIRRQYEGNVTACWRSWSSAASTLSWAGATERLSWPAPLHALEREQDGRAQLHQPRDADFGDLFAAGGLRSRRDARSRCAFLFAAGDSSRRWSDVVAEFDPAGADQHQHHRDATDRGVEPRRELVSSPDRRLIAEDRARAQQSRERFLEKVVCRRFSLRRYEIKTNGVGAPARFGRRAFSGVRFDDVIHYLCAKRRALQHAPS